MANFDPDKYLQKKQEFDPDKYLQGKADALALEETGKKEKAMAALTGAGQGLSLGYLPQLQAIAEPITDRVFNLFGGAKAEPAPLSQMLPSSPEYVKARDERIRESAGLEKKQPEAYALGELAGSVALPMPGVAGLAGGGSRAVRIGKALGAGAAMGAVQNPGDVEGAVAGPQVEERLKGLAGGALVGGLTQGAFEGAASAFNALSPKALAALAETRAFKAAGAMLKDARAALGKDRLNELGRTILDHGLVDIGDDVTDIAKKSATVRSDIGKRIGSIYQNVVEQVTSPEFISKLDPSQQVVLKESMISLQKLAADMETNFAKKLEGKQGGAAAFKKLQNSLLEILGNGDIVDAQKANSIIRDIDGHVNYSKKIQDLPEYQQGLVAIRNELRNMINNHISSLDAIAGSQQTKELLALNRQFHNVSDIAEMAQDRVARETANRLLGLSEQLGGGTGAVVGALSADSPEDRIAGALKGAAVGAVAARAGRMLAPSTTSVLLDQTAKKLGGTIPIGRPVGLAIKMAQQAPAKVGATAANIAGQPNYDRFAIQRRLRK